MKILFFIFLFITYSLSTVIDCKNSITADSFSSFYSLNPYNLGVNQGEVSGNLVYGDIDTANSPIVYYDDRSAICGGHFNFNRMVTASCNYNLDSCYDVRLSQSGFKIIDKNDDGLYTNTVTSINNYPCLPYGINYVTVGYIDYNHNDIGFATFKLTTIDDYYDFPLTDEEVKENRDYCPNLLKYIDELENIKQSQNTNLNSFNSSINQNLYDLNSIDSINETLDNLNSSISDLNNTSSDDINSDDIVDYDINPDVSDELLSFQNEAENLINSSFSSYSDVFGFGGYSSAPSSISFNMFGKTITLLDLTLLKNEHLDLFRNLLISSSYLIGFVYVFRSLS